MFKSPILVTGSAVLMLLSAHLAVAGEAAAKASSEAKSAGGSAGVEVRASSDDAAEGTYRIEMKTKDGPRQKIQAWTIGPGGHSVTHLIDPDAKPFELSDFWVGVECSPARAVLRTHLGLAEDEGLVVENVVPDGPAAKAGIEQYDVLLKAGDKPVKEIRDLIAAIDAAKESELQLQVIRQGKKKTVKVTPAKRPQEARAPGPFPRHPGAYQDRINEMLERLKPGDFPMQGPFRFRFFHPGAVLPSHAAIDERLPGNLSISITKRGEEPTKIVVQRDDEKWELTEEDLDKLPDDVRPHVERMLGRIPKGPADALDSFDFVPNMTGPRWGSSRIEKRLEPAPAEPSEDRPQNRMQKRMDEMNHRLEELRKQLDQLRRDRP